MNKRPAVRTSTQTGGNASFLLKQLARIAFDFSAAAARSKAALLRSLHSSEIMVADRLQTYHDLLCFVRAYPQDRIQLEFAESELRRFGDRIRLYKMRSRDHQAEKLENSGIAETTLIHPYSLDLATMLVKWYRGKLEIDWNNYDDNESGSISALLPLCVLWQENDILDNDLTLEARDWLTRARTGAKGTELATILNLLAHSRLPRAISRYLYESGDLPIRWQLGSATASRTLCRLPYRKPFYQTTALLGRTADLRAELRRPPAPLRRLSGSDAERYVRCVNETLAVRVRELFCITGANPGEVYVCEPGRSVQIAIFGSNPDIRLPLEANFGAMLVRNDLPIGYGVGAVLFDRVEIAINIFPAFRGGESAFVIEQFFKLFYHHFGSRVFLVRSRQMGDGDDEPIQSGAFWFYNKLGFRPVRAEIRALAERERTRIAADPEYRCSVRTLKRLSKSDVVMTANPEQMNDFTELSLVNLGYRVTNLVASKYDNNRDRATRESTWKMVSILRIAHPERWSADERIALERLSPLLSCIRDLPRWSRADKASLAQLIRAKGSDRERDFVLRSNRHPRFRDAIEELARAL